MKLTGDQSKFESRKGWQKVHKVLALHKLHGGNDALLEVIQKAEYKPFFVLVQYGRLSWLIVDWGCDAEILLGYVVTLVLLYF